MAFVCKQTAVLVVPSITLDNNNDILAIVVTLYFTTYLSWPDWWYFYCFFSVLNILTHLTTMLPVMSLYPLALTLH